VHLVGFIVRIYHDARSPGRQILLLNCIDGNEHCLKVGYAVNMDDRF